MKSRGPHNQISIWALQLRAPALIQVSITYMVNRTQQFSGVPITGGSNLPTFEIQNEIILKIVIATVIARK